jgi:rare lipoprotein A
MRRLMFLFLFFVFLKDADARTMTGLASWYDSNSACGPQTNDKPGCPTASRLSLHALERGKFFFIASNKLPLGSWVKITYKGRTILAKVVDRGGFDRYGRIADLSRAAFLKLVGTTRPGIIKVKIERIP